MRWTFWRRVLAGLALIVGVGVGTSTATASAQPVTHQSVGSTVPTRSVNSDWWW
jgi:hypothetical protein